MNEKQQLRARMRAARRAHVDDLPESTRALIMMRPPAPVAAMVPESGVVALYHPLPSEVPTGGYARWFHENGRTLALPWFADRTAPLQFLEWNNPFDDQELEQGPFGPQPRAHAALALPDAAFVPLLAFTADGDRLGQGGGHYDRWLAANPGVVPIGLAWDVQLVDSLPLEPHDRKLAAIVTPTRFYRTDD
ncbi:MAG: 5-formyltetrahydrofolate cyclo-ligase [Novosphingobium sp.]